MGGVGVLLRGGEGGGGVGEKVPSGQLIENFHNFLFI